MVVVVVVVVVVVLLLLLYEIMLFMVCFRKHMKLFEEFLMVSNSLIVAIIVEC